MELKGLNDRAVPVLAMYRIGTLEEERSVVEHGIALLTDQGIYQMFKSDKSFNYDEPRSGYFSQDAIKYIRENPFQLDTFRKTYYNKPEQGLELTIFSSTGFNEEALEYLLK